MEILKNRGATYSAAPLCQPGPGYCKTELHGAQAAGQIFISVIPRLVWGNAALMAAIVTWRVLAETCVLPSLCWDSLQQRGKGSFPVCSVSLAGIAVMTTN